MLIIVLSLLTAIGIAALIHAVSHAGIGYEDDAGFHYGIEPLKAMPTPAVATQEARAEKIFQEQPIPAAEAPAKRLPRKSAKKTPAQSDPIAALQRELNSGVPRFLGQEIGSVEKH